MHTFLFSLLLLTATLAAASLPTPPAPQLDARAWLLTDMLSGQVLAEKSADARVEPASLTKLMTAYLVFTALKEGRLSPEQVLPVSERAWRAEGSRMFLDPRRPARVEELLKGMIVQSGNDASIVLAEALGGSEQGFAAMMNEMARRLGMSNSHFVNATGLPHPQHYSSARDLARLTAALIRDYPQYYRYYALKEYTYNGITQGNRNRLLWLDPHVDGVKTGHTASAGYCLIASARRGERRLVSVVLGAPSEDARASESLRLLNYGFQAFDTVRLYRGREPVARVRLYKGTEDTVGIGFMRDLYVTVPRGSAGRIQAQMITRQPLVAPVSSGQSLGTLRLLLDGRTVGEYPLQALSAVPAAGWFGRLWDGLLLWLK
ncbi:MAG: D-alanyl-D-alanine carboxypeptidase [Thiobacillaceae bacterium]|nr:D-alanyl-D-alanine carboxypeptidase [Thiobacillaceae bacterium]